MKSKNNSTSKADKPPVLFHASRNKNINVFEPRAEKTRDVDEGPRVFGTPSRAMASIFLVSTDDSWVQSGAINDAPYIIISDEERFRSLDEGGAIYSLSSDTFENDPDKGLGKFEWTSKDPVTPIAKQNVSSALDDMVEQGVKVYFVDKEMYEQIQNTSDYGVSIIKNLTPYTN